VSLNSIRCGLALLVFGVAAVQGASPASCRDLRQARLSEIRVRNVHLRGPRISDLLRDLAHQYHIVIGFVGIQQPEQMAKDLDLESGTLADVMNAIVSFHPGYTWQMADDGAIHVYSVAKRLDLADVPLSRFVIENQDRRQIWESLGSVPQINAWLRENGCSREELFTGHEWKQKDKTVSFDASGKTLGEMLDYVAAATGVYFWSIARLQRDGKCFISIALW
jgi:hypothetical protein